MTQLEKQSPYSDQEKEDLFNKELMLHIHAMYNFSQRLTLDSEDAKDLVQEVYLKAYRFIDSYQKGTNAKAWLFRILKNSFINLYRKKRKEPHRLDYQQIETSYPAEESPFIITPELNTESMKNMMGDEISNALNSLDDDYKTVIILCDLEGFKYEEMASILEVPIGTVRSRLHRARNLLRAQLEEYAKSMGYYKS